MQPWRLIVIREDRHRAEVRRLAHRERLRQAARFDERAAEFLDKKIEGVVEAPLGICVCCDHGTPEAEILGRGTIPDTDVYSTACAIENMWLAARAEGLGVGWVSFYRPADLRALLGIPDRVDPIAYLCVGWPDERPVRPGPRGRGLVAPPVAGRGSDGRALARGPSRAGHRQGSNSGAVHRRPGSPAPTVRRRSRRATGSISSSSRPVAWARSRRLIERWAAVTGRRHPPRSALACLSAPRTTATCATGRACSTAPSRRRSPRRRPAARPRSACSRDTAGTSCSSRTSACAARLPPACATQGRGGERRYDPRSGAGHSAAPECIRDRCSAALELSRRASTALLSARSGSGTRRRPRRSRAA